MAKRVPTETKVISARAGAGGAALVSQALVWLLGCWVWGASWDADKATDALAAVPFPITALITAGAAAAGAQIAGRLAPHTHRPDLEPEATDTPTGPLPKLEDLGLELFGSETGA